MKDLQETASVKQLCATLGLARSPFYYRPTGTEDPELVAELERIALEFPYYGYRRLSAELRRRAWPVNHKRVLRSMRRLHLSVQVKRFFRTTRRGVGAGHFPNLLRSLWVSEPNQVWVADITYIRLRQEFVFLAVLMDLFTRGIRGWELGSSLSTELALRPLQRALRKAQPRIHHSDQGIQYMAREYVQLLQTSGVEVSTSRMGRATDNAFAERLIRTLKEEEVYLHEYRDLPDAQVHLSRFLDDVYMHKRLHSALGYLPPAEFEAIYAHSLAIEQRID